MGDTEEIGDEKLTASRLANGTISVPIGAVFMLMAAGGGGVAASGATMFGGGITAEQVAEIIESRLEHKEEVLDIKLSTINEKLERIEVKLDKIQVIRTP